MQSTAEKASGAQSKTRMIVEIQRLHGDLIGRIQQLHKIRSGKVIQQHIEVMASGGDEVQVLVAAPTGGHPDLVIG